MKNIFKYFKPNQSIKNAFLEAANQEHDIPEPTMELSDALGGDTALRRNERSVSSDIGGRTYRISSDDNYLNCIEGKFEPDMVELFSSLIRPNDVIFDVGANIGCTTILFGGMAEKVYSFEPSPTTFHFLKKNARAAKMDNVQIVNSGLGKAAGTFELTFAADNRSGGFVSNMISASEGHQVEQINIIKGDDFVSENEVKNIDFIKIDVEGFERDVLDGLASLLARDKPIVTLELNHWCLNVFQRISVPDFLDYLRGVFPYLYAVEKSDIRNLHNNNDSYHVMYNHIVGGFKYPNLVGAFDKDRLGRFAEFYKISIEENSK